MDWSIKKDKQSSIKQPPVIIVSCHMRTHSHRHPNRFKLALDLRLIAMAISVAAMDRQLSISESPADRLPSCHLTAEL